MIDFNRGVYLDTIESSDLDQLRTWRNSSKIRRWCRQCGLISGVDQDQWFVNQNADDTIEMFIIKAEEKQDGMIFQRPVGVCGLTSIDMLNRRAEFSLYIGPEFQGRGLAKKALSTLFDFGFIDLGLESIWGETFEDNSAAILFENIGMTQDGVRRKFYYKAGRFNDAYIYSILREEWLVSLP